DSWEVAAVVGYGRLEDDRVHLEDASISAEMLTRRALAAARVDWKVEGVGANGGVTSEETPTATPQRALRIRFPAASERRLVEVRVTAVVNDGRGNSTTTTTTLWNCVFTATDRDRLEASVAPCLPAANEARGKRRSVVARLALQDRTKDGLLTLDELRDLFALKGE